MKKILKNNKGITLVALVITIIILLILAGVSINIVFDEEGIINRAKQAAENMEIAANEEQKQLSQLLNEVNNDGEKVEYAPYDNPYIPTGFAHTEGTWNNGYTIKDGLGNEFVWVPCVTDQSKVKDGDKVVTFGKTLPSTIEATDPYYKYNHSNLTIIGDENYASDIRTSVEKYGGFYIAKYEAGVPVNENGVEVEVTSALTTQKARSVAGANTWTNITRTDAITVASNMIDSSISGVNSGLISSEAWDTTLKWIVTTSDNAAYEPNLGYDINSTGNGWYSDISGNQKTTTGQSVVNNIYDMAGNVWEWTTENCTYNDNTWKVARGGAYNNSSSINPAASRGYASAAGFIDISFRVVLYK